MTPRWYRRIRSSLDLPCRAGACVRTGQWGSRGNTCVCEETSVTERMPHCDERVLHAPGECKYCDQRPNWQALRKTWGIAFSDHDPVEGELPCPSEVRRSREKVNLWGGNVSKPEGSE